MAYKLRIIFSGLCVFAPQPVDNPTRMHVLMPDTQSKVAAGKKIVVHAPRLYYDEAYTTGNASQAGKKFVQEKLDGLSLDLTGIDGGAIDPNLPGIVNARHFTKGDLASGVFGSAPGPELASRITFRSGLLNVLCKGANWTMGSEGPFSMAHVVEWDIAVDSDNLSCALTKFDGSSARTLPPLYPINQEIVLVVLHVKPDEQPMPDLPEDQRGASRAKVAGGNKMKKALGPGDKADHFAAYYDLFDHPDQPDPVPIWSSDGEPCSPGIALPMGTNHHLHMEGMEMTCMVTKATDPSSAT